VSEQLTEHTPGAGTITADAVEVTFLPENKSAWVPKGTRLSVAAEIAGVFVDAPCGDRGVCGKCRVQVKGTLGPLTAPESKYLARKLLDDRWRLACQATVEGPCTAIVPRSTLQIAVDGLGREIALRPNARKLHLAIPPAGLTDSRSVYTRLRGEIAASPITTSLAVLRELGALALDSAEGVTVSLVGGEIVGVERGDRTEQVYGIAFDIGTTTVVGALVNLTTGEEVGVAATLNEQALYGADVISRVKLAREDPEGLRKLHETIIRVLNGLIDELVSKSGIDRDDVLEVTVVGNTAMHHLTLGIDPSTLGEAPFGPVVQEPTTVTAAELHLSLGPAARVYVLPVIAGHVGADTVGVVLATGVHHSAEIRLAVDIGTNGESVLGSKEAMVACSAAAGPAFEGTAIRHGMRATVGAIQGVSILGGEVHLSVIGATATHHVAPIGLCGSGLIDAIAEMRLSGIIDESGRMASPVTAAAGMPAHLRDRLIEVDGERAFSLSAPGEPQVVLTQRDVRELQLAKGAIYAGIQVLKQQLGVTDDDIAEVQLAGAFGSYIRPESAQIVGLIPRVPLERVRAVGNAARMGARLALTSTDARAEAEAIARKVEHQELFAHPTFTDEFMDAMGFPPLG
jgi:uncharacterized 2Fe-2S/4Fe-4S cluster protein (DUF4445 family)